MSTSSRLLIVPAIAAMLATLVAADQKVVADQAAPILVYVDHQSVSAADDLPAAVVERVRLRPIAIAHPSSNATLVTALKEYGERDPRFALRSGVRPSKDWFAEGGVGGYPVGKNDTQSRVSDFQTAVGLYHLGENVQAAMVALDPNDLPSGRRVESGYTQFSSTMDVRFTSTNLQGVYVETLIAWRFIGGGGGTLGGAAYQTTYPLELPNVMVDHVSTTVRLPIGLATPESGGGSAAAPAGGVASAGAWPRDPRVAFAKYRDGLEAIEKSSPKTKVVWATMPITESDNMQRSWFNLQVRQYCAAKGKPLFDVAALQSHGPDGRLAYDDQGESLAKGWKEPASRSDLNPAGREHLAQAWWTLMAKLDGWKPEAKDVKPAE